MTPFTTTHLANDPDLALDYIFDWADEALDNGEVDAIRDAFTTDPAELRHPAVIIGLLATTGSVRISLMDVREDFIRMAIPYVDARILARFSVNDFDTDFEINAFRSI